MWAGLGRVQGEKGGVGGTGQHNVVGMCGYVRHILARPGPALAGPVLLYFVLPAVLVPLALTAGWFGEWTEGVAIVILCVCGSSFICWCCKGMWTIAVYS